MSRERWGGLRRVAGLAFVVAIGVGMAPARVAEHRREHTILVRVLDGATGSALQNAEVSDVDEGTRRLTNELGEARLVIARAGSVRLRVRQIGYRFAERQVPPRSDGGSDTVVVRLSRLAITLPQAVTQAASSCSTTVDSVRRELSLHALEQLRFGAEQFDAFRRSYPFRVHLVRRTVRLTDDGVPRRIEERPEKGQSDTWGDRYEPGRVLHVERLGFSASILFVSALADGVFWDHHCLVARPVESLHDRRVYPLQFTPSAATRDPDWAGTAWLDSATSELRRIEFRMTGLGDRSSPRRLEGYMTFSTPSPYIALPDSIVAAWWNRGPRDDAGWGTPSVVQLVHVRRVEYLAAVPADSVRR